ncbi:MAG: type II toxin-antitoxin system PemK/MazF family toxin [Acidobacteriia bacterium]|nr:type II toxin-antitoxin system PemK/MazF family toxin [Terriglobia bacterium]
MTLRPGEVVLIRIDFHQTPGGKLRPAVVLLDAEDDDFVAAPVTSRPPRSNFDLTIRHWRETGLNVSSTIRVHKLTVLAKDEVVRRLAELTTGDRTELAELLRRAFALESPPKA